MQHSSSSWPRLAATSSPSFSRSQSQLPSTQSYPELYRRNHQDFLVSIESRSYIQQQQQQHPTTTIANLCDDTLLRILSYADLPSLIRFTRGTSRALRHRFHHFLPLTAGVETEQVEEDLERNSDYCSEIWREVFANLHLAPVVIHGRRSGHIGTGEGEEELLAIPNSHDGHNNPNIDYFNAIRQRLSLWSTLSGNKRRNTLTKRGKTKKQCFSLPTRLFHFVPLLPPDMMHFPPPSSSNAGGHDGNDMSFSLLEDDDDDESNVDIDIADPNQPDDNNHMMEYNDDPPPVEFACDSFALTSAGTGSEIVLLNPFSGSVEVYNSILDNAISTEEQMMEQAMLDASEGILRKRRIVGVRGERRSSLFNNEDEEDGPLFFPDDDETSEVIAGEAIDNRVNQSNRKLMYDAPPRQVLFSTQDYFDLNLEDYFGPDTPFATMYMNRGRQQQPASSRRGNVTVDWVGVDSHIALRNDFKSVAGNIIGAARILNMESLSENDQWNEEEELACTEVLAWSNFGNDEESGTMSATKPNSSKEEYSCKYVCRAAGSFYFLDICANYQKVYAAFQTGCCPFDGDGSRDAARRGDRNNGRQLMDIEEESMVNEDGDPIRMSKAIYCLPLIPCYDMNSPLSPSLYAKMNNSSYFPSPDACFLASYPVSSFSVDPTGKIIIVGTISGTVEVWHTGIDCHSNNASIPPRRLQNLSIRESFMKRHRSMTMDERHSNNNNNSFDEKPSNIEFDENATETQDDLALLENTNDAKNEEDFPHKHPTSKISQIYLPRHLPVHLGGFITKQRSPDSGTTLTLWQTSTLSSERTQDSINHEPFQITAIINLPLSAQCHPEVHFDGRRLIVFGKDHIGLIVLVYHVLGTRYDQDEFDEVQTATLTPKRKTKQSSPSSSQRAGEESGGVVQIGNEKRVKFVNRIRHAGLDGLEYYDSMLMACNERFLVVNTKAGNLIGSNGGHNASEGLLVIDLQEYGCY